MEIITMYFLSDTKRLVLSLIITGIILYILYLTATDSHIGKSGSFAALLIIPVMFSFIALSAMTLVTGADYIGTEYVKCMNDMQQSANESYAMETSGLNELGSIMDGFSLGN